jgi:hypothetical protein
MIDKKFQLKKYKKRTIKKNQSWYKNKILSDKIKKIKK